MILIDQEPCSPTISRHFVVFSSAVPSQVVPSNTQAFHEAEARVAAKDPTIITTILTGLLVVEYTSAAPGGRKISP